MALVKVGSLLMIFHGGWKITYCELLVGSVLFALLGSFGCESGWCGVGVDCNMLRDSVILALFQSGCHMADMSRCDGV